MRLPVFVILAVAMSLAAVASAAGRLSADGVSLTLSLGTRGASGVGATRETRTSGLTFLIVVDVHSQSGVAQTFSLTIGLPQGLRWGADAPDSSEGCVGTAPAVCTQTMSVNPVGTIGGGWYWDVVADRAGFYDITASVQPTEPDPDLANNTTTFRFEVVAAASGSTTATVSPSGVRLSPAKPKAGSAVAAIVRVSVDGAAVKPRRVACTGAIGKAKVKGTPSAASGRAICSYRPPKTAKGKTLKGSVSFTARSQRFTKRFSAKLG